MPVKTRKAAVLSCVALAATRSCAFIPPGGSTAALTSNPTRVTPRGSPCSTCSYVVAGMFGRGGGGRASIGASTGSRARKTLESSTVFIARTEQYLRGAITANDLVRSLERDVVSKIQGCDLEDAVAAALEMIDDKRKRDLLSKASEGKAIGPGGAAVSGAPIGGKDVTVNGRQRQYIMRQGGQRVSSGKSAIFNGEEVGKAGTPLKFKITSRANTATAAAEVSNMELVRARNGAMTSSRHFVGFVEYVQDYNGRGDGVMIMRAENMDMRKLAEANGGGLAPGKVRKYASEMAAIVRCLHKAGLVWTELKLDNLVMCRGGEVKAIDLESAVSIRSAPKAYTPTALPPDFARATQDGFDGVTVDRSFDVWSLGMAILHLYLGVGYFDGSSNPQVLAELSRPDFAVDLSGVRDGRLRGLLDGLLDPDPQKRIRFFDSPVTRLKLL